MFFIVGLGNPGSKYADTRHNVGFEVVDLLADRAGVTVSDKKFKARVARGRLAGADCFFMKPETYMNLSGESVGPALGFFKGDVSDVVVVHDDLDIDVGRLKLKVGGGHGGHNGLRSLMRHLPSDRFLRVRLGVGRPPAQWDPADYVLSRFAAEERGAVEDAVEAAADAVEMIVTKGMSRAMERFNRKVDGGEKSSPDQKTGSVVEAEQSGRR